jgi:hypothetical protein
MPYKDPKIRTLKAKEYQAAHRLRVKQNASLAPKKVRFCAACSVDISHMRSDAKFCSRKHKGMTSDAKRDPVAEYKKNAKRRRAQALIAYYADHAKSKERQRKHQKANPAKYASAAANHRAIKLQRTPVWVDKEDLWLIKQAYELAALRTKFFGFKWHVDHVIPLQGRLVSGLHVPMNMQVIPAFDNMSKHNQFEVV